MEEKKESPPAYIMTTAVQAGAKPGKKWFYGLLFYAGAVTATLVTVAILGSMYINSSRDGCEAVDQEVAPPPHENRDDQPQNKKHYDLPGTTEDDKEDIDLDLVADKEVIRLSGPQYGNGSLVVIDFKKRIVGVYSAKAEECYLVGGFDTNYPNTTAMDQILSNPDHVLPTGDDNQEIGDSYEVMYDRPVKDLSLLPAELYPTCWGKPVYWLRKDGEGSRTKRHLVCRRRQTYCCLSWYCYEDGEWWICTVCWCSRKSDCSKVSDPKPHTH